jgi:hypothetical protein
MARITTTSICFRTSRDLRSILETTARRDKRTLSATIEIILTDYLQKNRGFQDLADREQRPYSREG